LEGHNCWNDASIYTYTMRSVPCNLHDFSDFLLGVVSARCPHYSQQMLTLVCKHTRIMVLMYITNYILHKYRGDVE
jgi:hypothetical protein